MVLWAGYSFSKDYTQARGHYYAIDDIRETLRTGGPQAPDEGPMPSTCWTCKSPDVPRIMEQEGTAGFYTGSWARLGAEIVNPIGCADCHDEENMNLRISRPALIEAFERRGKDVTKASHGGSFHSPVEIGRTIANGISLAQEARINLARMLADLGHNEKIPYPDISTKAKAQEFIGLEMEKLKAEKEKFLENVVPEWDKEAARREASWVVPGYQ